MLVDHYCITSNKTVEVTIATDHVISRRRGSGLHSYSMETNLAKYYVTEKVYDRVDTDDSIAVFRSVLSGANQRVVLKYNGGVYGYNIGSTGEVVSTILLSLLILGIAVFIGLYDRVRYKPALTNLTAFLVIFVCAFLYFHFR